MSEATSRIVGMYTDLTREGASPCYVIARSDGTVVLAAPSASTPSGEQLPTVTIPGLTAEQLEQIVATATGTAQPAKGSTIMSTLDDATPRIGYVGGSLVGQVRAGHFCTLQVAVHRAIWFARDGVSDEWSAFVELPERDSGDDAAGVGSILITDPAVNAFMEQLVKLIADPEATGEATFGPKPTRMATEAA